MNVCMILGSVRPNRLANPVGNLVKSLLNKRGHEVTVIDPLESNFELLKTPLHFQEYKGAPELLKRTDKIFRAADGFILVTPEYNRSIPPAMSNTLSHFPGTTFAMRPAGIVSYSPSFQGGGCGAQHLRSLAAELGMLVVPNVSSLAQVHTGMNKEGVITNETMIQSVDFMLNQFDWLAEACKVQKGKKPFPKPQPYLPDEPEVD